MEELFELLFVIAAVVIGFSAKNNKGKKKASEKPAQAQKPEPSAGDRKAASRRNVEAAVKAFAELIDEAESLSDSEEPAAVKAAAGKAVKKALTAIETEAKMKQRAKIVQARVQASLSGESPTDEHGCIGGSMPEHNAEGESREEHAEHEHERSRRLAEETALSTEGFRKPTVQDLRRAVIMSEVLDKPVALRGRRS